MKTPSADSHVREKRSIVVVGAGAIGLSMAGWIFQLNENLRLLARGESVSTIRKHGVQLCQKGIKPFTVPVKVIETLNEASSPDLLVLTVKNYDLEKTAKALRDQLGNRQPIVVSLANGVENQEILPKYFRRIVYGVVCYNAWREGVGKVGYIKRGYIVIGTPDNKLQKEIGCVKDAFNPAIECVATDRLKDAAYCKLGLNLMNSVMSLVGFRKRELESDKILVHMTTRLLWEGVEVLQAVGIKQHHIGSMPSWDQIRTAVNIPESPANPLYDFIINRVGPTSMTQDVFSGKTATELESLNGYLLELSRKVGVPMPINQAVYDIAKERFGPNFKPISEIDLWEMINDRISKNQKI
ncbi:MAG TPA: 2-dehydropantoate 2-reductase [Candidatus Nanoarchaeia archaeon]|nr:2-dehydropantoate 2-reductase [Candidatus Nanoarchaeia archaeon]